MLFGTMYKDGQGVRQNYSEAARWFRLAADQGHSGAQFSSAPCITLGKG